MPQLFPKGANGAARFVLWGMGAALVVAAAVWFIFTRSGFTTGVGRIVDQPVPFSHEHHVGGLGIDCRYCHNAVETSSTAGLPATEVCMTCHSELWTEAEMLAPVRRSLATGEPIAWRRVHDLPDFVYFNHSIHVAKGVACVTCHGDIDSMPLTAQANPLTMSWCLDCHRDPERNLRPPEAVFRVDWQPSDDIEEVRKSLMKVLDIHPETMTDCYVCHR